MRDFLKKILDCRETAEIPNKLLEVLLDNKRCNNILTLIDSKITDKSVDIFRDLFQEEQSNRKELKQDYTPDELSGLLAKLSHKTKRLADVCSGTGSLTVAFLNKHPEVEFVRCEEFSAQPIPFLLLNLMLRNVNGEVVHGDSLTKEVFNVYRLKHSEKFSELEILKESNENIEFDTVISNPPYSLKWNPIDDERFKNYGLAPASKADYAFVLHALSLLNENGELLEILPHGVLFRGGGEGKIREQLLKKGNLTSVIGMPDKLFLNTQIPTVVLCFEKKREKDDVLFIDGSQECLKNGKQNILKEENILLAYNDRKCVDKFAYLSSLENIEQNDFNLNIPRYVDTYEPEESIDLKQVLTEWKQLREEIVVADEKILEMFLELETTNKNDEQYFNETKQLLKTIVHTSKPKERKAKETQLTLF